MKTYEFRIGMREGCRGVDTPVLQWDAQGIDAFTSGTAVLLMEVEAWDEIPDSEPYVSKGGEDALYQFFIDWLSESLDMRGKPIDGSRFSPRQLYEALSRGWQYGFAVDGDVPQGPEGGDIVEPGLDSYESATAALKNIQGESSMHGILERTSTPNIESEVRAASTFSELKNILLRAFGAVLPPQADEYKDENSDYGLKVRGVKARERINAQCRDILERVNGDPAALTEADKEVLRQYSGRGGTSDNSQYEYYTPKHVAEGAWDAMKANGFVNGNVLDPCCGAGIFSGTKPAGVVVSGNDIDPVGSGVAALLNPGDAISTRSFEDVVVNTEDDTFDSAIGNVPFGNARGASMHLDPAYKNEKSIERYFLLRALDKIRPGGLAVFVCPVNIVGARGGKWSQFRIALSKKAEFLGAHKLPSKTFAAQGTNTVVDVVVLRKHGRDLLNRLKADEIPLDTLKEANVVWEEFISGKYWQGEGRKFIMGRYVPKVPGDRFSREKVDGDIDDMSLKRNLARRFQSRINWDILNAAEPILRAYQEGDRRSIDGEAYELRNGEWVKVETVSKVTDIDPAKFGVSSVEELGALLNDPAGALRLSLDNAFAAFKAYPELLSQQQKNAVEFAMSQSRDDMREQAYRGSILGAMLVKLGADEQGGEDVDARRKALQEAITSEIERFGHPANNPKLSLTGTSSRAFGVFMNAVDTKGNFSDLLAGKLDKTSARGYVEDNVADIVSYLQRSKGDQVELEDVQALYKGTATIGNLGDLAGIEGVAITAEGMLQPASLYCAGDVVGKMASLTEAIAQTDDARLKTQFRKQIDEMNRKIQRVGTEDITFGLQNKWFSKQYILDFLHDNGYPNAVFGEYREMDYQEDDGTVTKKEQFVEDPQSQNGQFHIYGVGSWHRKPEKFVAQFEKYLNGENITSNEQERIAEYKDEARRIEGAFDAWMKQHLDIDELTEQYNLKFNGWVPVEYDTGPLDIDDIVSGNITPHTYQCAEVRRLSEQGAGICGFGTGLGKSFTALAMAGYNFKHGRAKRTCIVVPSSVLENWYHEARVFYNEGYMRSNVLFVGLEPVIDKNGNVERRAILDENGQPKTGKDGQPIMQDVVRFAKGKEDVYEAMWKIPQSNYSLVVMTKEKFESIPIKPETMREYTNEMVSRHLMSEKEADALESKGAKKRRSYQDDVKQIRLEGEYSNAGSAKKGELPYLEDMGFDSIITDESHFFKNSLKGGKRTQGITYVPNPVPSNIAIDMSIKTAWLRRKNGGRGVYGLTATPVTNSPIEIFNMLNLVCPKEEFEAKNIYTVDDFVRFFGDIQQKPRATVSTEIKWSDTLVGFKNLSGLRGMFSKYVNIKTVKDVDDEIHVPSAVDVEEQVEMTTEQAEAYEGLRKQAAAATKTRTGKKGEASIFSIMRNMDRCTTDMDLFKRQMTFVFSDVHKDKIQAFVPKLPTQFTVQETDEDTGEKYPVTYDFEPQLVDNGAGTFSLIVHEQHEEAVLRALREFGIDESETTHPLTPKYAKLIENLKKHLDVGGKQIVFTEEKSQHQKLKRILVHNLPIVDAQVAIINAEDASGDKLDKISKAYNSGSVKIVIANKKAEVGVNLQKGTTAIHHLTLPWTPASIDQRNGRGVRQGNTVESVDVYYYEGKGTFDAYRKQLLQAKAGWIGALLTGKDARAENADVSTNEEMLAVLTGTLDEYRAHKAEEEKRRANAARDLLVNRLRQLASIQTALSTLDERRQRAQNAADAEVQNQEARVRRYEAQGMEESALKKARQTLEKLKAKAAGINAKYDTERQKSEAQRKMITGILRQAEKQGDLPFDAALIDHPENCLVTLDSGMYSVGEFLEFPEDNDNPYAYHRRPVGVYRITGVRQDTRMLELEGVMRDDRQTIDTVKLSSYAKKVSYSASEIALKRLLTGNMPYHKLATSGLTRQQFEENRENASINTVGGAFVQDRSGAMLLVTRDVPENMHLVWPEPQDADFRKQAMQAYLEARRNGLPRYSVDVVMDALFGRDFEEEAASYGNNATETEAREVLAQAWVSSTARFNDRPPSFFVDFWNDVYRTFNDELVRAIGEHGYDNIDMFNGLVPPFLDEKRDEAIRRNEEALQEAKRKADEALRNHPDFKEVPSDMRDKFRALGIDILYNTTDTTLSFRNRAQTIPAFSRLFMYDSRGMGGSLYRMKEILKSRYGAQFTKAWSEHGGAWWHVQASVNLNDLYELLA